jgi:drug/metabolite transporter (DMT)-like permease
VNPYRLRSYFLFLVVSIIWAVAGPVIKFVLGEIPPLLFLIYRFFISGVFALFYFLFTGFHLPRNFVTIIELIVFSLFTSTFALGLLFWGLKDTTVLDMSIITLVSPLVITVAGVIFLREHVTKREKVGMAIALVGALLTIIEPILNNGQSSLTKLSGNLLITAYLFVNAVPVVLAKKLLRQGVKPGLLANLPFLTGFFSLLPFLLMQSNFNETFNFLKTVSLEAHLGVFYMALLSGTLAYWLSNIAQKTIEISESALFTYLYPILSIPLAIVWLNEKVTLTFVVGAIITLIGVAVAEIKKVRKTD